MTPICVPYRGDDGGQRDKNWRYVRRWWEWLRLGPVIVGDVPGPFSRAGSRNRAAELAGDWQVAVFGDADTFMLDPAPVRQAIEAIELGQVDVVLPHDEYIGLTATGTRRAHGGQHWRGHVKRTLSNVPLGIMVASRRAWDQLGGFDVRFASWGGEDVCYRLAAATLVRFERTEGTLVHLWHPNDPTKRAYLDGSADALRQEYRVASGDPAAMQRLLEDR